MSEIHESLTVLCPFDQAPRAAEAYLASLPTLDGSPVVALRVMVGDLTVERRADLLLKHARSYPGYEIMDIEWRPHHGGPYPVFHGTITIEDETGNYCHFELDGKYAPPLGIAGAVFDSMVGHHIALSAARELLDEIKTGVELAFQTGATVAAADRP